MCGIHVKKDVDPLGCSFQTRNPSNNKRFTNMSAHPSAHLCVHGVSLHGKYRYYFNKVVKFTLKKFIYASKLHTQRAFYTN